MFPIQLVLWILLFFWAAGPLFVYKLFKYKLEKDLFIKDH